MPYAGLVFLARPEKDAQFTYLEIYQAVDLLQFCGPERGGREEMWAYVFVKGERVGQVSIEMGKRTDGQPSSARNGVGSGWEPRD